MRKLNSLLLGFMLLVALPGSLWAGKYNSERERR